MVNTKIRLIIFFVAEDGETLYSQQKKKKKRLGPDCGSGHELLLAKFKLKLKNVGKTTKPFRCDLNEILYAYTMKVTSRFKGSALVDRVPEELWAEVHDIVQDGGLVTKCVRLLQLHGL